MNRERWPQAGGAIAFVILVWLLYLAVKVAQHVNAWPF
jgi:hypothetical protein